jgi:hypothetical protein
MRFAPWVFGLAVSLASPGLVRAETVAPAAQSGPTNTARETESYAGSIIVADAGTLGIVGIAAMTETPEIALLGIPSYLLVPPIIHGVQRNWGGVALSVVARVSLPLVFSSVAFQIARDSRCPLPDEDPDEWRCDRGARYALIGAGIGALTAMTLDAAFLARRPVRKREATLIVPTASWSQSTGWALGVQGRF